MVLTQRHTRAHAHTVNFAEAFADVQPIRIVGLVGAIALNAAALMMLLVPVSAPLQVMEDEPYIPIWEVKREPPPPEPKPIEVPVVRQQLQPRPQPIVQPQPQPLPQPVQQDLIVPDGSEYTPDTTDEPTTAIPTSIPNPDPQPSTRLEYASAPAPTYPREALLDGIEGTVVLKVLVDVDGKPLSVEIERSSGNRRLDEAARRQVLRKWSFKPAIRDGRAVKVYGMVPVSFSLNRQ